MPGRILIVDNVATNRIVLKVVLVNAQYQVVPAVSVSEARDELARQKPDLILIEASRLGDEMRSFLTDLRAQPATADLPVVAIGHFGSSAARMEVLALGADDALEKPLNDALLLARIRSLLRARDADMELRLREDTNRALGFAEGTEAFQAAPRVAYVAYDIAEAIPMANSLRTATRADVRTLDPAQALAAQTVEPPPDVFVVDARAGNPHHDEGRIFRLLADLRSRSSYRHCAQLLIAPDEAEDLAAMALDLGANDIARSDASVAEIGWRVARLGQQKSRLDRLRDTVQSGLRAAVTDQLTGLYNRRYALPHLDSLAQKSRDRHQPFAIMVLDIDHFKQINDTYGHAVGDAVLVEIADRLRGNLRAIDLVARVGGEEFLVAMPDTSVEQALGAAERIRRLVNCAPFAAHGADKPIAVSLSIGVAMGGEDDAPAGDISEIVGRADAALYTAKSAGRNTVTFGQSAA